MGTTHRIKVRIGVNEFEAEGDQGIVSEQYADFLKAVQQSPPVAATPPATPTLPLPITPIPPASTQDGDQSWDGSKLPRTLLDRIFRKGDPISLLATPRSEQANADALLVLLYGLTEMIGETATTGTSLRKSASKSGVNVSRIGETLNKHKDLIQAGGERKGRRYSLNNRGLAEAERIIRGMVE